MKLKTTYYDLDDLVDRLSDVTIRRDKAVTFLVGSPLTTPDHPGGYGVPDVSGIIDLILSEFLSVNSQLVE